MPDNSPLLQVYQSGVLTVVGFGGVHVPDEYSVVSYRDQILKLINDHKCEQLAFDLTGVKLLPSGLLGLLSSIRDTSVEVHLYNPSPDVREVLAVTSLDKLMPIFDVPI